MSLYGSWLYLPAQACPAGPWKYGSYAGLSVPTVSCGGCRVGSLPFAHADVVDPFDPTDELVDELLAPQAVAAGRSRRAASRASVFTGRPGRAGDRECIRFARHAP